MSKPGNEKLVQDDRECRDCRCSKELWDGWICNKHLMAILPDMHVSYYESKGSCWTAKGSKQHGQETFGNIDTTGNKPNPDDLIIIQDGVELSPKVTKNVKK